MLSPTPPLPITQRLLAPEAGFIAFLQRERFLFNAILPTTIFFHIKIAKTSFISTISFSFQSLFFCVLAFFSFSLGKEPLTFFHFFPRRSAQ